eukprot:5316465-Lingulodinium_polyedra.AAC.1
MSPNLRHKRRFGSHRDQKRIGETFDDQSNCCRERADLSNGLGGRGVRTRESSTSPLPYLWVRQHV